MRDEASDLLAKDAPAPTSGQLAEIRGAAVRLRELQLELKSVEERQAMLRRNIDHLVTRELPEMMDQAGVRSLSVSAMGNVAAFTVSVKTMYRANIAANWPPERREEAFAWLDEHGHGSLIKTEVNVAFPREQRSEVAKFTAKLGQDGRTYGVREAVNPQTLTAWFKDMMRRGASVDLEAVGGYVERHATIKEEEEER